MMRIEEEVYLDFDDVLIRPKRSLAASRKEVELRRTYKLLHSRIQPNLIPLIASNMDTTGTFAMGDSLRKLNCFCALHKFYTEEEINNWYDSHILGDHVNWWRTIGISDIENYNRANRDRPQTPFLNVDIANGYTETFVNSIRELRQKYPGIVMMAGNVATPEMVQELLMAGADIVKIGIGPGSVCETRIKAGVGVPQLTSIIECADVAHGMNGHICADGGCRTPGDVAKAFGAGADFVMIGGMLAGTDECDGEWQYKPEVILPENLGMSPFYTGRQIRKSLKFYGMSSEDAMVKYHGKMHDYKASEGKAVMVPYKGPAEKVIRDILGGLRSCCAYVGAKELKDLSKCTTFIRVNRTHNTVFN